MFSVCLPSEGQLCFKKNHGTDSFVTGLGEEEVLELLEDYSGREVIG